MKMIPGNPNVRREVDCRRREWYSNAWMPRKIRQLVSDLERAGFALSPGGKGSHRKFRHLRFAGAVILSGRDGDDAHHYQEKQIRNAIREVTK